MSLKPEDLAIIEYLDGKSTIVHKFLLYILSKDVTLIHFALKTFQGPQLAKSYPRFQIVSLTRIDSFRVQRLCQKEDNVRGSNKDANVG